MAKFNVAARTPTDFEARPDAMQNLAGGLAFKTDVQVELYLRCAATLVGEPKYYDEGAVGDDEIPKLVALVAQQDPEFILQLAAYCRNDLYLRSIPMLLLVEATKHPSKAFVRRYTPSIIQRADELAEVVAYYTKVFGHIGEQGPKVRHEACGGTGLIEGQKCQGCKKGVRGKGMLVNSLKRGLAEAFHGFGPYHFSKYDRDGKVKLSDVIRIVHPKPRDAAECELFAQVRKRTVPAPQTWEVMVSGKGSTKESWTEALKVMPYMATLRNLRNLLDHDVDIAPALKLLETKEAVLRSKQFPYRFLAAYKMLQGHAHPKTQRVLDALSTAIDISVENIPHMKGTTFIATDHSGSMDSAMSHKSKISLFEVGATLSAMARGFSDDAIAGVFGGLFAIVNLSARDSVLTNVEKLRQTNVEHSTNAWLAIDHLVQNCVKVDRILIFSDMQCYDVASLHGSESLARSVEQYRRTVNHDAFVYSFDVAGYGASQFPQSDPRAVLLSGWSDRVLQFIPKFEAGGSAIAEIKKVTSDTYRRKPYERMPAKPGPDKGVGEDAGQE